jgi:hypothetical protein
LFNGKDLTVWKTNPNQPGDWHVEDSILMNRGKPSRLFRERGDDEKQPAAAFRKIETKELRPE